MHAHSHLHTHLRTHTHTHVPCSGVVTEYLRFEQAEGGLGDIMQLDVMLKALGFSQTKADSEVCSLFRLAWLLNL